MTPARPMKKRREHKGFEFDRVDVDPERAGNGPVSGSPQIPRPYADHVTRRKTRKLIPNTANTSAATYMTELGQEYCRDWAQGRLRGRARHLRSPAG